MYARESSRRLEDNYKPRKILSNMPSFSSTLLDEIYRSTDEKCRDFKEKAARKQTSARNRGVGEDKDEEAAGFRRGSLIDKWMTMEKNKPLQDNDLMFFSSTSSSSDSSGALSSSDTEFFGTAKAKAKSKVSCFTAARPKPIRTGVPARDKEKKKPEDDEKKAKKTNKMEDDLMKYRSRALKVYAKLKEMKQPISPGARLTSFISTLFNNNAANGKKKSRNLDANNGLQKVTSSTSSLSKSCLSKSSPKSREEMRGGLKRTVRFHPASVIGEDTLYGKPPLPPNALEEEESKNRDQRSADDSSMFRGIAHDEADEDDDEEEDYDAMSDSSSDLFEIDHLSFFGNDRFCEELPVYETTNLGTNRTVASSGSIR